MNPTQAAHVGMNRTGIQMSPLDGRAMQDTPSGTRFEPGDESALADMRSDFIANADALGSVPPPGTVSGAVTVGIEMLKGENPSILLDKLGERIAFERTGTRMYDALITKCEVLLEGDISMTIDDLRDIRSDEARHFIMVYEAVTALGGDPTAQTPCADLAGVEASGLLQVLGDPRTTIPQCLHAILTAELADRAGWETLIALADEHGLADMVDNFTQALEVEREHLALVQTWYEESLGLAFGDVDADADAGTDTGTAAEPGQAAP